MKISVITVCFNSQATIERAIQSVVAQQWLAVEHLVIDGGSTDGTLAILERFKPHLAALVSEPDKGIYDAMNKGVALATGDVVVFLNADDFYKDSDVLARVARVMQAEKLDALYGDVEFFMPGQPGAVVRRYDSGRFTIEKLGWGWMPAHPALFVRRALFDRYGAFCAEYRIAGDFEFIARIFKNPELRHRHLSESLVRMQLGGASTNGWRATWCINREMMRACRANAIQTSWFKILARYPIKALEFFRIAV